VTKQAPIVSVVVPVFNEAESILEFSRRLRGTLDGLSLTYEVIYVNDGSTDQSEGLIESLLWDQARVISLVSNAGHMAALDAGLRQARGNYVISMDSDLQHPPEMIPELIRVSEAEASSVVYTQRVHRSQENPFRRAAARFFYRAMAVLSGINVVDSAADFRLMTRPVINVLQALPPGKQVFRLLIPSLGFPSSVVPFEAHPRFAGKSKYTMGKLVGLSLMSMVGFSTKPLTASIRIGMIFSLIALGGFIYVIVAYFVDQTSVGWASIMSTVLLSSGLIIINLGVLGVYLADIAERLRARPQYIIRGRGD
jgi:dolichol-phosphate mannosyltransferase